MTMLLRFAPAGLALLALAACDSSDPEQASAAGGRAEGEVLGGTISDEMIPLDQLRSQSPPLRAAPTGVATAGADTSASASEADEPAVAPEAEDAPEPADDEPAEP
jgi:hypothetical protein